MANRPETSPGARARALWKEKLELARRILAITGEELLLVELDGLGPLLERKQALIAEIEAADRALAELGGTGGPEEAESPTQQEFGRVVAAILENERALEARMDEEFQRLRKELRQFERETTLRGYLEARGGPAGRIDLKK